MKVELTISRKGMNRTITRVIEVKEREKQKAKDAAKLIFLNEYINRDVKVKIFDDHKIALNYLNENGTKSGIKINANIIR